ncbi:sensor histidine kinase, partial [Francisella tularensis subsp. holarctica]|uniref:sensor histidine kinase n=1 Tax=Francisella tularensis TaxID=263 RepID=UPI002381BE1D
YIIEIADQGIGINNVNTVKIFEIFFHEEKSRSQTGNGLGLALVKKIIKLHDGDIIAQNNKPQGLKMINYHYINKFYLCF